MTEVSEDDDGEDDDFVGFSIIRFLFYLLKKENINIHINKSNLIPLITFINMSEFSIYKTIITKKEFQYKHQKDMSSLLVLLQFLNFYFYLYFLKMKDNILMILFVPKKKKKNLIKNNKLQFLYHLNFLTNM
jgi:hypothetical protein